MWEGWREALGRAGLPAQDCCRLPLPPLPCPSCWLVCLPVRHQPQDGSSVLLGLVSAPYKEGGGGSALLELHWGKEEAAGVAQLGHSHWILLGSRVNIFCLCLSHPEDPPAYLMLCCHPGLMQPLLCSDTRISGGYLSSLPTKPLFNVTLMLFCYY